MKIVYYTFVLGSKHGGSSHAFQFLDHLRKSTLVSEVRVFPEERAAESPRSASKLNFLKTFPFTLIPRFYKRSNVLYGKLKSFLDAYQPDVLIIRPDHNFLQIGRLKRDFPGLLLVSEINSSSFDESYQKIPFLRYFRRLEKRTYQRSDLNFFVSDELQTRILGREADSRRDFVAYNGTDPLRFTRTKPRSHYKSLLGIPSDHIVIGYMGTLDFDKRIELLIESFADLRTKNSRLFLLIIGDGPDRIRAEHLLNHYKLRDCSHITGWIQYDVVADTLFAMDIAVHHHANPYNCPLKIFDYLAAGIPTVAPNIPFVQNNFIDVSHLRITESTAESISSTIQTFIDSPEAAERLGESGQKYVAKNFTWQQNTEFILSKIADKIHAKN